MILSRLFKPLTGTKIELETRLRRAIGEGKLQSQPKELKHMEKGLKIAWEASSSGGGGGGSGAGVSKKGVPKKDAVAKIKAEPKGKEKIVSSDTSIPSFFRSAPKPSPRPTPGPGSISGRTNKVARKSIVTPDDRPRFGGVGGGGRGLEHKYNLSGTYKDNAVGGYDISAPEIANEWSRLNDDVFEMQLFFDRSDPSRIIGNFDLGIVTGGLKLLTIPTGKQRRVAFTWCGSVGIDEPIIQYGENHGWIEFTSTKDGMKIKGVMEGVDACGNINFSGIGGGAGSGSSGTIDWDQWSASRYEYENKARWGSSW